MKKNTYLVEFKNGKYQMPVQVSHTPNKTDLSHFYFASEKEVLQFMKRSNEEETI